jgi:hypothetical protein
MKNRSLKKIPTLLLTFALVLGVLGAEGAYSEETTNRQTTFCVAGQEYESEVAISDDSDCEILEEIRRTERLQAQALEAYWTLRETFEVTAGVVTYPDDYAGAWVGDDGSLHVALVSERANIRNYSRLLRDFDVIVFEEANFSLNELDILRDSAFDSLSNDFSVVGHYVDVHANRIVLEFETLNEREIRTALSDFVSDNQDLLSANRSTNENRTLSERGIAENVFSLAIGEMPIANNQLIGGMEIRRGSTSGGRRTMGICGTFTWSGETRNGFITAGHNLAISGADQRIFRRNPDREVGLVSLLMWQNNGNGDWAAVRRTDSSTMTNLVRLSTTSTIPVTRAVDDFPVGAFVPRYGDTTKFGQGRIEAQNVAVTIDFGNNISYRIQGLTRTRVTLGQTAQGGDSGMPYFTTADSTHTATFGGIHCASVRTGDTEWFTPYVRFRNWFTVRTS